ncbi:MAG: type II secretion system protein GspG [Candidatus Dependentiae bacterium]|nr:type II secretion system protein GspG [Candidatus Dependentiae bacterium]
MNNAPQLKKINTNTNITTSIQVKKGFTLVELMMVIGILAGLMAFILPQINKYKKQSDLKTAKLILRQLQPDIENYQSDTGSYPSSLNDLIKQPENAKNWNGPYIANGKLPVDPWGRKYHYSLKSEDSEHSYELFSYGPKGKKATKNEHLSVWDEK